MSQSTVKALRRDLRRTVGEDALGTIGELQSNLEQLANSLSLAHQRLDQIGDWVGHANRQLATIEARLADYPTRYATGENVAKTFRDLLEQIYRRLPYSDSLFGRLRWLVTGR